MPFLVLYVRFLEHAERFGERVRRTDRESGQGALEYVGMLLLAAAIVTALLKLDIGKTLKDKISSTISDVFK